jgi:hypothetical protein
VRDPAAVAGSADREGDQAAGRPKPSWYLISQQDNAIPPDAERFIAQPVRLAGFIKKALAGTKGGK